MRRVIPNPAARAARGESAFTMVEIALALAVIGFALVAIVGVLPLGMEVQKQNRQDTIIDHDANYVLDCIRNGARGADDLTNYFYEIRHNIWDYPAVGGNGTLLETRVFTRTGANSTLDNRTAVPGCRIDTGARIIGLLGLPKYQPSAKAGGFISNNVVAYVRALSGAASEKMPQQDAGVRDLAFNYRITAEIVPLPVPPYTNAVQQVTNTAFANNLRANLHDVRLLYRWPVKPNGEPGPTGREIYRTLVSGRQVTVADTNQTLFYFQPSTFRKQ